MADDISDLMADQDYSADGQTLESWVVHNVSQWKDHLETNYFHKWDEYYRIWRGIWSPADRERESERSQLIAPATQQAVESSVSELEEATFGRGSFFDIDDEDVERTPNPNVEILKRRLAKKFKKHGIRKDASEVILNAAVFGTGIGEIALDSYTEYVPKEQEDPNGLRVIGRERSEKVCVKLNPVNLKNFRIPPTATSIDDALGVAVEEFVSPDYIFEMQKKGIFNDDEIVLGAPTSDIDLEPDPTLHAFGDDKVRIIRYYGRVPRHLLEEAPGFEPNQNYDEDSYYTEAIVVIAYDNIVLKAQPNPFLMNDRPIVAFPWDVVPGRFWGRGVCEKGYNPQKALDAELRQRRDAMAMNVAPMIGIDSTRLPMIGQKLRVTPGKQILTNGDPREILHPFRFGDLPQTSFLETDGLARMVQTATGAVDSAGITGQINGEGTAAGISMSLGAIIKRHKRTLINFQESFLIPFVKKCAWRYMQFAPEEFPVADYDFIVSSSLGIMAREYEVGQMTQLLQTMPPESPAYGTILESIIDNMAISNRDEIIANLRNAQQPSQQEVQAAAEAERRAEEVHQAQLRLLQSQAMESESRANKYKEEARLLPLRLQVEMVEAAADINNDAADDFAKVMEYGQREFDKKLKVGELALKEKAVNVQKMQAKQQARQAKQNQTPNRENVNGSQQNRVQ